MAKIKLASTPQLEEASKIVDTTIQATKNEIIPARSNKLPRGYAIPKGLKNKSKKRNGLVSFKRIRKSNNDVTFNTTFDAFDDDGKENIPKLIPKHGVNSINKKGESFLSHRSRRISESKHYSVNSFDYDSSHAPFELSNSNRYHVLSYAEVQRVNRMMETQLTITPRSTNLEYIPINTSAPCSNTITSWCSPAMCYAATRGRAKCNSQTQSAELSKEPYETFTQIIPSSTYVESNNGISCDRAAIFESDCCHCGAGHVQCLPIIHIQLKQLIHIIRTRLMEEQVVLREIRLNGGAAGSIIRESFPYIM